MFYRLERIWNEEVKKRGAEKASFARVVIKATRSSMIFGIAALIICVVVSFTVPVGIVVY
jgi:hypothetical protein